MYKKVLSITIAILEERPSSPSIRFKALVKPAKANIVKGKAIYPKERLYPKNEPRFAMYTLSKYSRKEAINIT